MDDPRRNAPGSDEHRPVMLAEVCRLLAPAIVPPDPVILDATLGLAGHTIALLTAHPTLTVIGVDRDTQALERAQRRIAAAGYSNRFIPVHATFDHIDEIAADHADLVGDGLAGALFDLGVSSMQLDRADRGFAYAVDAPLDMRMDQRGGRTAADILADYSQSDLARVLRTYGEERFAGRIAAEIVRRRRHAPLTRTAELVEVIRAAVPAAAQSRGGHPAKRTFQALRIEVNDELGALRRALPTAVDLLRVGGRIVVMSYQSLEDRLVKAAIAPLTRSTTPAGLPVELPGHGPRFTWLTRRALRPTEAEITDNPRARAARLRAAERIEAGR